MDASGRRSTASNARSRHDSPRGRTKDKTHSVSGSLAKSYPGQTRSGAEGEGEMTDDPKEAYGVMPREPERRGLASSWCTVKSYALPVRRCPGKTIAQRFATDPEYRAS